MIEPILNEDKLFVQFLADEALVAKFVQAKALLCGRYSEMSFADVLDVLVTDFLDRRSPSARKVRREAKKEQRVHTLEIDHIVPFAAGGNNDPSNLRLLCAAHNLRAAERTLGARVMAPFWRRE